MNPNNATNDETAAHASTPTTPFHRHDDGTYLVSESAHGRTVSYDEDELAGLAHEDPMDIMQPFHPSALVGSHHRHGSIVPSVSRDLGLTATDTTDRLTTGLQHTVVCKQVAIDCGLNISDGKMLELVMKDKHHMENLYVVDVHEIKRQGVKERHHQDQQDAANAVKDWVDVVGAARREALEALATFFADTIMVRVTAGIARRYHSLDWAGIKETFNGVRLYMTDQCKVETVASATTVPPAEEVVGAASGSWWACMQASLQVTPAYYYDKVVTAAKETLQVDEWRDYVMHTIPCHLAQLVGWLTVLLIACGIFSFADKYPRARLLLLGCCAVYFSGLTLGHVIGWAALYAGLGICVRYKFDTFSKEQVNNKTVSTQAVNKIKHELKDISARGLWVLLIAFVAYVYKDWQR